MVWLFFLLRYLDIKNTGGDSRDVCPCKNDSEVTPLDLDNDDIIEGEDVDVKEERQRVVGIADGEVNFQVSFILLSC